MLLQKAIIREGKWVLGFSLILYCSSSTSKKQSFIPCFFTRSCQKTEKSNAHAI